MTAMCSFKLLLAAVAFAAVLKPSTCRPDGIAPQHYIPCNRPVDILFVLDSSSSIHRKYVKTIQAFIKDVISSFNIGLGPFDARVGLMLFSTREHPYFDLNTYQTKAQVNRAIDEMPFPVGETYTHLALRYVNQVMLSPERGARQGVDKLVIVMTDGESFKFEWTKMEAEKLKARGVDIFALGVGEKADSDELVAIGSSPSDHFVHTVTNFEALHEITVQFIRATCDGMEQESTPPPPPRTTTTTTTQASTTTTTTPPVSGILGIPFGFRDVCESADIYFILDASSSVHPRDFKTRVLPFVQDIVSSFKISPTDTRVGLVIFSDDVHPQFGLSTYATSVSLMTAVSRVQQMGGNTNTSRAITYVAETGLREARRNVPQIVITLTDGNSQRPWETAAAAKQAHDKGVKMFAIGVGPDTNWNELLSIASSEENTFSVDNFDGLEIIKEDFAERACREANPKPKPTPKESPKKCKGKPADIYFILDASSSIDPVDFKRQALPFIQDIAASFKVSPVDTRVGAVTFSDNVTPQFGLSAHTNNVALHMALGPDSIQQLGGNTNTSKAINYVAQTGLGPNEARRNVAHIIITLTDGQSQRSEKTVAAAYAAKAKGIYMFAVGVGNDTNTAELNAIASSPEDDYVFHVRDYAALGSIAELLATKTCDVIRETKEAPEETAKCSQKPSNIWFVHNRPGSQAIVEDLLVDFSAKVAEFKPRTKMGLLTQPCVGGNRPMMSVTYFQQELGAIKNDYEEAYQELLTDLYTVILRPSLEQKVVVFIIDESTQYLDELPELTRGYRDAGIEVAILEVGHVGDALHLNELASTPSASYVFRLESYDDMINSEHIQRRLLGLLCAH